MLLLLCCVRQVYVDGIDAMVEHSQTEECPEAFFADGQLSAHGINQLLSLDFKTREAMNNAREQTALDLMLHEMREVVKNGLWDASQVDIDNIEYVICQPAKVQLVQDNTSKDNGKERDTGHEGMRLADFCALEQAVDAELSPAEVAALRLYTTSSFRLINKPLRTEARNYSALTNSSSKLRRWASVDSGVARSRSISLSLEVPLPVTTIVLDSGLKKLRACHFKQAGQKKFQPRYLYRGLRNKKIGAKFMRVGGTEAACLSCSENVRVAAR